MSFFIIFRIIQRNYTHSLKAIRGLGFTIAIIISLLALITGLSFEASAIIFQSGESQSLIIEKNDGGLFPSNLLANFTLSQSLSVLPMLDSSVQLQSSDINTYVDFIKMNLTLYFTTHKLSYIQQGRLPLNNSEIVIGSNLANVLNITVGANLILNHTTYNIVGIVVDEYGLLNSVLSDSSNLSLVNSIEIVLSNSNYGQTLISYLHSYLPSEYSVVFKQRNIDFLNSIVTEFLSKFVFIVIIIAILSCIRIYFFTNWIIINHLRDFLILRVIGYSKIQMLFIIISFGIIIGNLAILYGTVLGLFLPILFASLIKSLFSIRYIPFFPPIDFFIYTILILNFFLVIGSIKPALDVINSPAVVQQFERA